MQMFVFFLKTLLYGWIIALRDLCVSCVARSVLVPPIAG